MMIYQNSLNNSKKEQNIFIIFLRDDLSMDIPFKKKFFPSIFVVDS